MKTPMQEICGYLGEFPVTPLPRDTEYAMITLTQQGDQIARNTLILHHMIEIANIVKKYCPPTDTRFGSVMSEGVLALTEAITDFDLSRPNRLKAYAKARIQRAVIKEMQRSTRVIDIPEHISTEIRAIKREEDASLQAGKSLPASQELAKQLGIPINHVWLCLAYMNKMCSLENIDPATIAFVDQSQTDGQQSSMPLFDYTLLDMRERLVLQLRYQQNLSREEVAQRVQRTSELVRRIEKHALSKLSLSVQHVTRM